MAESEEQSDFSDVQRLQATVIDLRREIELLHQQQAYLQMQITLLLNGAEIRDHRPVSQFHGARGGLISIIKRNRYLYRLAFNLRRYIRR